MSQSYSGGSTQAYQGYPYLSPMVQDIPSVSAEEAAKWSHLPRRPAPSSREQPGGSGSGSGSTSGTAGLQALPRGYHGYPYASPVVRDPPASITAEDAAKWNNLPRRPAPDAVRGVEPKELSPMVFIDEPVSSGSQVAERRQDVEDDQPFVQDTIFYDQFKNRRIVNSEGSSASSSVSSGPGERPALSTRPNPPSTLNLASPDSGHSGAAGGSSSTPGLPSFMSKEAGVYGQFGISNDAFQERDFPEPPPAYTERDMTSQNTSPTSPAQTAPTPTSPSSPVSVVVQNDNNLVRTQVIIPSDNTDDPDKKFIECTGCGYGSYGLVVKQSGLATHVIACFFLVFMLFPITLLIYYSDFLKYKNYYCRQCNKLVAYQGPLCWQELEYY